MKKIKNLLVIVCSVISLIASAQCISPNVSGHYTITTLGTGTLSTCTWAGEFNDITINATGNYIFISSLSNDFLTLTDGSNNVIASGYSPLATSVLLAGVYRLHVSTNTLCGTQSTCRATSYNGSAAITGCVNNSLNGHPIISSCSTGTLNTCLWAGEYTEITMNATGNFSFTSSVSSDYLTLTDGSNTILASGNSPFAYSFTSTGIYRLHASTNGSCGTQNTCRILTYGCSNTPTLTPCFSATQYPSNPVTISSCSSGVITTVNYSGEYSVLNINLTGSYVFTSSIATDYLTFTDGSNNVIAIGTTPLPVNINTTGVYRLHVSSSSSCIPDNTSRTTGWSCSQVCSGTPNAGTTNSNYSGGCTAQTINFSLQGNTIATGLTYQWQSSPNNSTWTDIPSQTNITMSQLVSANMYYRCLVSCGTFSSSSSPVYISIGNSPVGGSTVLDNAYICSGTSVNFSLFGASTFAGMTYQWESSTNGTSGWNSLSGETSSTMSRVINSTKYYRCILTCGTSTVASSTEIVIVDSAPTTATTQANSSGICGPQNYFLYLSGSSSSFGLGYQWQSSINGSTWSNIFNQTSPTANLFVTSSTYYRCVLTCGTSTASSTPILVTIATATVAYANLPYYQTFDNIWQDGCDLRNVPTNQNWKSTPSTGDLSWRRQDDGSSANWTSPSANTVTPQSGSGCANFHSSVAFQNQSGSLDLYVNMNQNAKYALTFYYLNVSGTDKLNVLLSTDAGTTFSNKGVYTTQSLWAKKTLYFNAVNSASCVVRFQGVASNISTTTDIGIDSLGLRLICLNPTVTAAATTTNLCSGSTVTLSANGATNYTWTPGNIVSANAVVSPTANTHYVVTGSNDGLCFPTAAISVSVSVCNGIEELSEQSVSVFPNPTTASIYVEFSEKETTNLFFELYDAIGKLVYKETLVQQSSKLSLQKLENGIYFYRVLKGNHLIKVDKLIKD